jgi:hypothetical protein
MRQRALHAPLEPGTPSRAQVCLTCIAAAHVYACTYVGISPAVHKVRASRILGFPFLFLTCLFAGASFAKPREADPVESK